MKNFGLFTLASLFLLVIFINTAEARLVILSSEEMIEQSNLIVIGTVMKKEYSEKHREVHISIEAVLKGKMNQKEIVFMRDKDLMYGWLEFDFPDAGTKIMVLTQQDEQLSLTGDANAVSVLDGDNIRLYHGSTMGRWTPEKYEETYKAFLDENQKPSKAIDVLSYKGSTDLVVEPQREKIDFSKWIALIGFALLITFFLYRALRQR